MAAISVVNLTFSYDNSFDHIFENASFSIDTSWKLGFVGRNGRGKTTFLNLLMGKHEYSGKISSNVSFDYFPFEVKNKKSNSLTIASEITPDYRQWELEREISLLGMETKILERLFETLSKGEQTKVLLAILFLKDNNFLLIDEPTNHLDAESRIIVSKYLKSKKSYILVSHDRKFLDSCIDHVLAINRASIEVQKGNFSSWWENRQRQDNFELVENKRLQEDIDRLKNSAKRIASWAGKGHGSAHRDGSSDSRSIGFKGSHQKGAAKLDKASKRLVSSREKAIEQKSRLLKNIETAETLKLNTLDYKKDTLLVVSYLSVSYGKKNVFEDITFKVEKGERVQLRGNNGSGKSSIIKLILGEEIEHTGHLSIPHDIKISYVSQDTSHLSGTLTDFAIDNVIDETLFKAMLAKLDFDKIQFEKKIEHFSQGQKKKVLIAKSLCEEADLYIWDEPLNYIDVISRMQIEDLILNNEPTMIFVEHDETFAEKIATDIVSLNKKAN